jgi:Methyltransferase domain
MKQLEDSQLETFDIEYVNDKRWQIVQSQIDKDFPDGDFSFLDVGGGNGMFADRLLDYYPRSRGTVLDNSQLLLDRNKTHPHKKMILDSVENLSKLSERYDLICFNWLLHHLVGSSYSETRKNISTAIESVIPLLTDDGRVSIFENMYNGLLFDGLPSRVIFTLTSNQTISGAIKKMGANTAGVGVCFLSQKEWMETVGKTSLKLLKYSDDDKWFVPIQWKVFLHVGNIRCGHFWLIDPN